jgi:transportin-3
MRDSAHVVLGLCEGAVVSSATAGGNDVATTEAVLGCLQSWIRIVDIDPALLERTALLPWVFDLLADSSNGGFELAVDLVVEILRTYPSNRRGVEGLVRAVIPRVMALGNDDEPHARPSPFRKSMIDDDEDGMRGYCRIFTEMSESYLSLILSHEEMNQSSLVELVLRCSSIPDMEIAGITLHFWYRFVVGLEELEPFEYRQVKIDSFAPQLARLLDVCTRLLRYPVGVEDLSPDRLDDIEGTRMYFADTIEDCCRLLGGDAVLRATGDPLQGECRRVASLPPDAQLADWHGIEGYMYAIQAVSMYVPSDEARIVPFVMGLIPQLPGDAPLLRATACRTVGRYASWLGKQPSHLGPLLPYLAQGLSIPKCASSAAIAIREICERCDNLGDTVLQLYDGIVAAREQHRMMGGGGGEDFILDLKNEVEVLEGVCKAVSSKLTNDPSIIQHLARPIIENLRAMASPEAYPSSKQISAEFCRLTTLVQHLRLPRASSRQASGSSLNRSDFILSLMGETWPMLDAVSQKHPRDFNCGEKLCRLHKHALRECGPVHYAPLLKPLAEQTVKNFSTSLSSPYLYLASIIVSEYGRDATHSNLLYDMMASLATTVFQALRSTDDFTAHPDVVEEFFFLAGRMVSHCPSPLVQSSLLNSLLQCAGVGMKLHHKDANRGTLNFLESTVSYSLTLRSSATLDAIEQANIASLEQAIVAEGQPLVTNLALALLGDLPAYRLDSGSGSIAGVLFYLNQLCPELLMQWIQPPLTAAPEHAKSAFLVTLHNRVARDEFNSSVRRFTAVCEHSRKNIV